jgi:glutaredoxin
MEKEVNVYVTPKSPHTDEIREYLAGKGIDHTVFDISSDVQAHKRMLEATRGAGGPPVIEVGHQVVLGFDKERLEESIAYELH